jgi:hypothetical protein
VSPSVSLILCSPNAIRASAARASPCPPVATISTSRRGRLIAVSKSIVSGKSFR